jgi:long-chain-fatty-acid--CoA ligase ACSBG
MQLAKALVLGNIHKQLGLDKCKWMYSGAAPITKDTLDFFISLGLPLCEVYGMSESTGPHCVGLSHTNRVCSVGQLLQFNRSKLINKDNDDSGELCVYGRHVYMGYLNDETKTNESFDDEGWLRTGDIAKINENFIFITGRLKELIITAGGENIAPVPIESNLWSELPRLISNSMLVGDRKKYLVILVTLKVRIFYPLKIKSKDFLTD